MPGPVNERDGLELMLQSIRKNIQENQEFLKLLKSDCDVMLSDDDRDDLSNPAEDDFEEL